MMKINIKNIIIIGSSTGGPHILKSIFLGLPVLNASIIIVQHMPSFINDSIVSMIGGYTEMNVSIAKNGDFLKNGHVFMAPSKVHLELRSSNTQVRLFKGEKVNFTCPSIDVTMKSIKKKRGERVIGIILTGMGKDGAEGISHIKKIGGTTIAQDKETSAIFSMPKAASETGDVDFISTPEKIKHKLISSVGIIERAVTYSAN